MHEFNRIVVVGASRGVGAAIAEHLVSCTTELITVSRSPAVCGNWVEADISTKGGIEAVKNAIGDFPLDALLYMGFRESSRTIYGDEEPPCQTDG